jgi:hypothetical protein
MPTFFSRKYMRGKPSRRERWIGVLILVLAGLLIAVFLLTSGLLTPAAGKEGVLASIRNFIGISQEPLFEVQHRPAAAPDRRQRVAGMLLPPLTDPWRRKEIEAVTEPGEATLSLGFPEDTKARDLYRGVYQNGDTRLRVFIAGMGDPRKAWQLLESRRPVEARDLNVGRQGWRVDSQPRVGFWAGPYYTEVEAEGRVDTLMMEELARNIAEQQLDYGGPFDQEVTVASQEKGLEGEQQEQEKVAIKPGRARFARIKGDHILKPEKIERYAENLYEKIDGKEGMFRAFNVVDLRFGQYRDTEDKQSYDVYIYDMGKSVNAMGIYMKERNPRVADSGIGRESYRSGASVYFWKGQYYVNVLGPAGGGDQAHKVARNIAQAIADTIADKGEPFWAEKWLPKEDRVEHSFRYVATSGLGYDFLREIFMASYETDGTPYEMFLHKAATMQQAGELFDQFVKATGEYDKVLKQKSDDTGAYMTADSMGYYTVAFTKGRYFGGVCECEDLELAEQKARMLQGRLPGGE